jgi:hypothetical protein
MDTDPSANICRLQERLGRAGDQVPRVGGQGGVAASRLNASACAHEAQSVEHLHRMHDRFQLVKTVRTPSQDVEQQVDLAGRVFFQVGHEANLAGEPELQKVKWVK